MKVGELLSKARNAEHIKRFKIIGETAEAKQSMYVADDDAPVFMGNSEGTTDLDDLEVIGIDILNNEVLIITC